MTTLAQDGLQRLQADHPAVVTSVYGVSLVHQADRNLAWLNRAAPPLHP